MKLVQFEHPWQQGPSELILYALEHLHKPSDFEQRIAFLLLDVGVETTCKTFLELPEEITGTAVSYGKRKSAAEGTFHDLIQGVKEAAGNRIDGINLEHVQFYHDIRNKLYHKGNGITVPSEKTKAYAQIAADLLSCLLGVNCQQQLLSPEERYPEIKELQQQLETLEVACQPRLRMFLEGLPALVEHVEPDIVLPSFGRLLINWAAQVPKLPDLHDGDEREISERYERWVKATVDSMPPKIGHFVQRYLNRSGFKIEPMYDEQGELITSVYHTPDFYQWVESLVQTYRNWRSPGIQQVDTDAAEFARSSAVILVAQKTFDEFENLSGELDRIKLALFPPPPEQEIDDEIRILKNWVDDRQTGLNRLLVLTKELERLISEKER